MLHYIDTLSPLKIFDFNGESVSIIDFIFISRNLDFNEVDKFNDRLDKTEDNTLDVIDRSLNRDFRRIEESLRKNYDRLKNNNELLPDEKAAALFGGINTKLNQRDRTKSLNSLYKSVSRSATKFNQTINKDFKIPNNLNDPIDFWTIDGNNRINDWNNKFLADIQSTIVFAYSQKWSQKTFLAAIRKRYGQLKSEVARVVATGVTGVSAATSQRFAQSSDRDFVILKTTVDDRVCNYCAAREGNVYRRNEISLPLHPYCRCVLIPVNQRQIRDRSLRAQLSQFKETALSELSAAGGKPNYDVSPFEKKNGAMEAPKPVISNQ